eukprot:11228290-Lingulodinium_polyedra.AAC.1
MQGKLVATAPPAPKPTVLYFPQYHRFSENGQFWGEGFTEWAFLEPYQAGGIQKPLGRGEGGLGYYDMTGVGVRERQGELAKAAGLHAFCFYHYWFSGSAAPARHEDMFKVVEAMLQDNEPNAAFMLSWANEPWDKRWTGENDEF